MEERAQRLADDEVKGEIERRAREAARRERGDLKGVHACPASSADVPDEQEARLVVLGPDAAQTGAGAGIADAGHAEPAHRNGIGIAAGDDAEPGR